MEVWQILVLSVTIPAFLGWIAWISNFVIRVNDKANKSLANDEQNSKDIEDIGTRYEGIAKRLEESMFRIENRLDLFLKTEIEELKSIAKKL